MCTADPASPAVPVAATARYQLGVAALVRDGVHGRARTATTVVRHLVATMFLLSVVSELIPAGVRTAAAYVVVVQEQIAGFHVLVLHSYQFLFGPAAISGVTGVVAVA